MGRPLAPGERHIYLSTACEHGEHDECGRKQRDRGEVGPPHCKFCPAVCVCPVCDHAGVGVRVVHVQRPSGPTVVG